mmetsp:Transcript_3916/g.9112  ORF Transcript_3916/g.9112 Transcript_3916/m.9112 type:complete len:207 (+) Transcript_3916:3-623(+)
MIRVSPSPVSAKSLFPSLSFASLSIKVPLEFDLQMPTFRCFSQHSITRSGYAIDLHNLISCLDQLISTRRSQAIVVFDQASLHLDNPKHRVSSSGNIQADASVLSSSVNLDLKDFSLGLELYLWHEIRGTSWRRSSVCCSAYAQGARLRGNSLRTNIPSEFPPHAITQRMCPAVFWYPQISLLDHTRPWIAALTWIAGPADIGARV